jgi:kojibiose phosphorylase
VALSERLSTQEWLVEESDFQIAKLNFSETIFTVGNGYQGTRGSLEEGTKGERSGTLLAGIFDHHDSTVIDLVNAPSWLPLTLWIEGTRLDVQTCKLLEHRRVLDMRKGVLYRLALFEDAEGRRTRFESLRYASFSHQHLCGIHAQVTAENYDAEIMVESAIDGERFNLDRMPNYVGEQDFHPEVKWEKWAKSKHLQSVDSSVEADAVYLEMETMDTGHRLGYATALTIEGTEAQRKTRIEYERISEVLKFDARQGTTYTLDKLVAIYTSRDVASDKIQSSCLADLRVGMQRGFATRLQEHEDYWKTLWSDCDCVITGEAAATHALRFNIYHLLITANKHDPKVNIGAKTLSGEGYKGHVFWDTEIFMLPFFIYAQPETARALLLYRYHTMAGALENARANGFKGAQYPWEAADTGVETTPKWTADGAHRIWTGEEEIHITADVAYGVVTYLTATEDWQFFLDYGAEILFNTARFWESRLEYNETQDRYELSRVIGPDEFHEHVDNNVFTNWMARWNLQKAIEFYHLMKQDHNATLSRIAADLELRDEEVVRWGQMADKIFIPFDRAKQLIEQFEGYFKRKEVPITHWDENNMPTYPSGYDHFNADETTLLKQPDVIMLMYVLPDEFDDEVKRVNYAYYEQRTLHKSSLSPSMHSIMGIEVGDTEKAEQYFLRSAQVDLVDNQGNTEWGMHAASTAGTWMCVVFGFGGFRVKNRQMTFKPWLPEGWEALQFKLKWHGDTLSVTIRPKDAVFYLYSEQARSEEIVVSGQTVSIPSGREVTIPF